MSEFMPEFSVDWEEMWEDLEQHMKMAQRAGVKNYTPTEVLALMEVTKSEHIRTHNQGTIDALSAFAELQRGVPRHGGA